MRTPTLLPGRRDIIRVGAVDLSYRVVGAGPPLVVLHDRYQSGAAVLERHGDWSSRFTLVVPDLPGHGESGPHPRPSRPPDRADTVVALAEAVGLLIDGAVAGIVGIGTSAYLAAAVAARLPGRVGAVVVADLPTDEEAVGDGSAPPARQWDGSHLLSLFHRVRHQYLYSGLEVILGNRIAHDVPEPWALHGEVLDYIEADAWPGDGRLAATLAELVAQLVVLPAEIAVAILPHTAHCAHRSCDSMAQAAGDLVPRARTIRSVGSIAEILSPVPAGQVVARPAGCRGAALSRRVVTVADPLGGPDLGIHVRGRGSGDGTPLVLLSSSPASARTLEPLIEAMSDDRYVVALDNPGQGYSDHPFCEGLAAPALYAAILDEVLDGLELDRVSIWATHTGAAIGVEFASRHPERVDRMILDGLAMFDVAQIQEFADRYYLHPLRPDPHGAHLVRSWHIRRDMFMFFPWYASDAQHARLDSHPRDVDHLHTEVVEYIRSGPTYHYPYGAALRYDPTEALGALQVPTLVCAAPIDPLKEFLPQARRVQPDLVTRLVPGRHTPSAFTQSVALFREFFDAAPDQSTKAATS